MEGDRDKCIAAGMDDYLSKPASIRQLYEKLETWISLKTSCQS
jgi:CheY-like chemotaxis protein